LLIKLIDSQWTVQFDAFPIDDDFKIFVQVFEIDNNINDRH